MGDSAQGIKRVLALATFGVKLSGISGLCPLNELRKVDFS